MDSYRNVEEVQSRMSQKRGYQWLMNASEQELLLNKRQAIELVNSTSSGDTASLAEYLWCSNANANEQLVPSDSSASRVPVEINFLEKFGNDPSTHSSTSEDHNLLFQPILSTIGRNSLVPAPSNVYESFRHPYYLGWIQNNMPFYEQSFNRGSVNIPFNGVRYLDSTAVGLLRSQPSANVAIGANVVSSSNVGPLGQAVNNVERSIVPFGGFDGYNHREIGSSSSRVISNVYANQPINGTYEARLPSRAVDIVEKNEEEQKTRKARNNHFPLNVKSLLSTGVFDGVPVKYVPWSREKSLKGVIKGPGYMCSCEECKLSKCVTAYEFEIHAGFKSSHPNSNIYFPNGKSIHAAVLELQATPRDQLFDAVENMTGSIINRENFLKWKASYQAEITKILGANVAS